MPMPVESSLLGMEHCKWIDFGPIPEKAQIHTRLKLIYLKPIFDFDK